MGPWVPSLAVSLSSRPFGKCFTNHSAGSFSCCLAPRRQHRSGLWDSAVSCPKDALLNASLALLRALGFAFSLRHQPSLSPPSQPLDASFFTFAPILGFGSPVSPALICFFSPDCEFLVVIVHLVSLSRCSVRDFSSGLLAPPAPSCCSFQRCGLPAVTPAMLCSTLLRRSRWTCASAVVCHNLVCCLCLSFGCCHCVVHWGLQHHDFFGCVKCLCLSYHFRKLLPFTCPDDSCLFLSCTGASPRS